MLCAIAPTLCVSKRQIIDLVARACGCDPVTEQREPAGGNEVPPVRQAYSCEKAKRLLGWEPQVPIETGYRAGAELRLPQSYPHSP
jgi:nucleoside-diphosphate-sugar epimerase